MVEIIRKSHWSTLKTSSTSYWPCPIYIWSSPFAVNSCLKIVFLLTLNNIFHSWPKYFGSFWSDWVPTTHFWCIPNKVLFSSIKKNSFESLQRRQWKSTVNPVPNNILPWQGFSFPCSRCKSGKLWQVDIEPTLGDIVYVHSLWSSFAHFAMTIVHTHTRPQLRRWTLSLLLVILCTLTLK